ncbi:MAG TPA: L,D-transpeptidase family protein, partial [Acidimicrobiia bacterium]|nr:L,D-transpeptidase family protein [Acidimicrobiia bacterium]
CGTTSQHPQARPRATHPVLGGPDSTAVRSSSTSAATTTGTSTTSTTGATRVTTPDPATLPPSTNPATVAAPAAPLLVTQVVGLGSAQQAIVVAADGDGTSTATVTAYERDAGTWKQIFGPWAADIGRNGVAPIGAKREGDGRTPSGVFGFDFMFGVDPDPGVRYPYRHVGGSNIVWDDDPTSPNYNEWIDTNTAPAGVAPEPMDNVPSYLYGAVIAYNDARTPGLGSAIFLHVSHASSTAGCVALPIDELLELLRWLDPHRSPRIAIGTAATLTWRPARPPLFTGS